MSCDCFICSSGGCCSPKFKDPREINYHNRDGITPAFRENKNLICLDTREPRQLSLSKLTPVMVAPDGEEWHGQVEHVQPSISIAFCVLNYIEVATYNVRGVEHLVVTEKCSENLLLVEDGPLSDPGGLDPCV